VVRQEVGEAHAVEDGGAFGQFDERRLQRSFSKDDQVPFRQVREGEDGVLDAPPRRQPDRVDHHLVALR
jgi:hypothetical protein